MTRSNYSARFVPWVLMARHARAFTAIAVLAFFGSRSAAAQDSPGVLTLRQAVALALERSPDLAGFSAEARASEARQVQAGVRPNTAATADFEDFAGSGNFRGASQMQTTLRLGSLIELGGKRGRRRETAEAAHDLARSEYDLERTDVLAEVTQRFITVVSAQDVLALARESTASLDEALRIVRQRVEAGRTSALEEKKAAVALARSRIEEQSAERDLAGARMRLASSWGDATPGFDRAEADLFALETLPALDTLLARVADSPEIARFATEKRLRESEIWLARAKGAPDATFGAGVRRVEDSGDHAFVAGVTLPLPLFDRNRGGVAEAQAVLEKTEAAQRAAENRWRARLSGLYQDLLTSSLEVEATRREILPQAEEALRIAEQGFREARYSYLELADAQRTLRDVRRQLLAAATTYHLVVSEIERLTGNALIP